MIPNITYGVRNPLVTKAMQIYATRDRRQSQHGMNFYDKAKRENNRTSLTEKIDLYGYGYETIEPRSKSNLLDVRV